MIRRLRRQRRFLGRTLLALLALAFGGALLAPCITAIAAPASPPPHARNTPTQSGPQIDARCGGSCSMPDRASGSDSPICTQGCSVGHTMPTLAASASVPAAHIAPALHALAMPAYGASPRVIPFPPAADRPPPRPVPHRSFAILLI